MPTTVTLLELKNRPNCTQKQERSGFLEDREAHGLPSGYGASREMSQRLGPKEGQPGGGSGVLLEGDVPLHSLEVECLDTYPRSHPNASQCPKSVSLSPRVLAQELKATPGCLQPMPEAASCDRPASYPWPDCRLGYIILTHNYLSYS